MSDQILSTQLIKAFVPDSNFYELIKVEETETEIQLSLRSRKTREKCPNCGQSSNKFKKKYTRRIKCDTYGEKEVILIVEVHSFKCQNKECSRKTFSEDLSFAQKWQQRSDKLNRKLIVEMVQSGFRGGAKSKSLNNLKISQESMRRLFSRIIFEEPEEEELTIVGIDDLAIKSGHKYMTQISELEEESIKLLKLTKGRTSESIKEFLTEHPEILFVTRDRSNAYSSAVKKYLPGAIEVADRFHLIQNCIDKVEKYLKPKLPASFRFENGELVKTGVKEMQKQEEEKKLNRQTKTAKAIKTKNNCISNYTRNESVVIDKDVKIQKRKDLLKLVCRKNGLNEEIEPLIKVLLDYYPCISTPRKFFEDFYQIIMGIEPYNSPEPDALDDFIFKNKDGDFKSFIKSIQKDKEAIRNAIIFPFLSSGKVEGLNNKIKLIKRKGFGNYDLETLEKMIKLSYEHYHGSINDIELKPTARKSHEIKKPKNKARKETEFKSWFDQEND